MKFEPAGEVEPTAVLSVPAYNVSVNRQLRQLSASFAEAHPEALLVLCLERDGQDAPVSFRGSPGDATAESRGEYIRTMLPIDQFAEPEVVWTDGSISRGFRMVEIQATSGDLGQVSEPEALDGLSFVLLPIQLDDRGVFLADASMRIGERRMLPPGHYQLVSAQGANSAFGLPRQVRVEPGTGVQRISLAARLGTAIARIRVVDPFGEPVDGVRVALQSTVDGKRVPIDTLSRRHRAYCLERVRYNVVVDPNVESAMISFTPDAVDLVDGSHVFGGMMLTVDIVIRPR